jgi:Icc-related predicted phosphoesterase
MKILALSDVVVDIIYNRAIRDRFSDIDLAIGCGDLPYYYLEYIVSSLDIPVFFVRGNHSKVIEYGQSVARKQPQGAIDLHSNVVCQDGLILAGIEGCLRYKPGPYQYTQAGMWLKVFNLIPALILHRLRYGRFIDIFVTHASPWGIHDQPDLAHQGIKAFRWFLHVFKPRYHLHGHVHVYHPNIVNETLFKNTHVINTYGYTIIKIDPNNGVQDSRELNQVGDLG